MGKKGSNKKAPTGTTGSRTTTTLREESIGKKQTNANVKSILKLQHIKNLAVWASGEASIPSLGAFFGHHLAACTKSLGTPPDPSLFTCQRCESILQPGYNCTIRIEKNRAKLRHRRKRPSLSPQNNVAYTCHFCSKRNLIRGTSRGHVKAIRPLKTKAPSKSEPAKNTSQKSPSSDRGRMVNVEINKMDDEASLDIAKDDPVTNSPTTPLVGMCTTLLEGKRRKRNRSASKKAVESGSNSVSVDTEKADCTSIKRRRGWTSLKEIAESSEHGNRRDINSLTIPFFL